MHFKCFSLFFIRHGDDLIVTPFAQVCVTLALAHSLYLWVYFLRVASEPSHLSLFASNHLKHFFVGSRQLAKCEKQLHYTDKPAWSIQQVSMGFWWSHESLP